MFWWTITRMSKEEAINMRADVSDGERKPVEIRRRLCESLECEYDPRSGLIGHVPNQIYSREERVAKCF